ncbi:hypothetical protein LL912_24930 [Niabella sp. CC-SYL272]|uniref:hypothetical protein n=1 Tax=Niabella agricola TaxID=2891571 RepID=UPI001F33068E|nr:hypothetical protein [Niabella agricola]MCF3112056.1 hypothetical protein [Niabella agricola]
MANIRSYIVIILTLTAVTRLYACAGQTEKNRLHRVPVAAHEDTVHIRLENVQQYNSVVFKNNAITQCATTEKNCRSDMDFITSALQLADPTYKTTQLEATIYKGTALLNNAGRDSLKTTYYLIKTENTGALQQLITRLDTANNGYVRKMAKTEAPIACYFTTTPNEVLLITHIGIPEFQKLKNQPLVAAVKERIGSH